MSRAQDLFDRLVKNGDGEVQNFIAQPVTEELFLDYKQSADDGSGNALHTRDRANLAKAISGFGNSEGGIIVWGVECKPGPDGSDVPSRKVPIVNPDRFKSWLEQANSGLAVPPHTGVRHHAIHPSFVATLIPGGLHAPYQAVPENSYYMRAGSNFAKVPHAVLSGLFGRRPQPAIRHQYRILRVPNLNNTGIVRTHIDLLLCNFGRGIASDIFLNLSIKSRPGQLCKVGFANLEPNRTIWSVRIPTGDKLQMITQPDVRLAPDAEINPVIIDILLQDPIESELLFEGMCGCSGGEPWRFEFKVLLQDITDAFVPAKVGPTAPEAKYAASKFN